MLNLSQLARESPNVSFVRKIRSFRDPNIYLAENLADYQQNAPILDFPRYKRFLSQDKFMDRAYIIFQNVGLKKLSHKRIEILNWFVLHDDSGQELVYWNADHELFPTLASFDEVQEKQGLKEDDWVYDVFIRYLIPSNLPSVVEVNKYKFSNRKPEKDSLAEIIKDKIGELLPQPTPEPIPVRMYSRNS